MSQDSGRRRVERGRGAAKIEYLLVVGLVALALLVFVLLFGRTLAERYRRSAEELGAREAVNPPPGAAPESPSGLEPGPTDPPQPGKPTLPTPGDTPERRRPRGKNKVILELPGEHHVIYVFEDGTAEVTLFDEHGNKRMRITASRKSVDQLKDLKYSDAAFAGRGTINFCNGSTYAGELVIKGARGGLNLGVKAEQQQREKQLWPSKPAQDGEPSAGIGVSCNQGWDLLAIHGT